MKYSEALVLSALAVFAPIKAAIIVTFILVIADLITGIWAAVKRSEPITSAGIKRTVGKILLYETSICLAFLVETYLTGDLFPVSKMVASLVGICELKSVIENMNRISGSDFTKIILSKITKSQASSK